MGEYIDDLISVIVPIYNTKDYLVRCIESIINQTYKKLEVILVDDGSTDGSDEICREYSKKDDRVVFIRQENSGVVEARNNGIRNAHGKYIAFVDSDDYIELNMYENLLKKMGNYDLISSGFIMHDEFQNNKRIIDRVDKKIYTAQNIAELYSKFIYDFNNNILYPINPANWSKIFLHKIIDTYFEKLNKKIFYGEDTIFLYEYILRCNSVIFLDECYYHYNYVENSVSHKQNFNMLENNSKLYIYLKNLFESHSQASNLKPQLGKMIMLLTISAINNFLGFDKSIRIPKFVIDIKKLKNKKIALYGAGYLGQEIYYQLKCENMDIAVWVDEKNEYYKEKGYDVASISSLLSTEYDFILIAIKDKKIVKSVKNNLINLGIDTSKIVVKEPIKVF